MYASSTIETVGHWHIPQRGKLFSLHTINNDPPTISLTPLLSPRAHSKSLESALRENRYIILIILASIFLRPTPPLSPWPITATPPIHLQTLHRYHAGWRPFLRRRSMQVRTSANHPYPTVPQPRLWALHRQVTIQYSRLKRTPFVSPSWFRTNPTNFPLRGTTLPITMPARLCMTPNHRKVTGRARIRRGPLTMDSIMGVRPTTLSLRLTSGSLTVLRRPGARTKVVGPLSLRDVQSPSMGGTNLRRYNGGMRESAQPTTAPAMASYPPSLQTDFTTLNIHSSP